MRYTMRNLICIMLVGFLPLTLASQTQKRFRVAVFVVSKDDDAHIKNTLESHIKREFRLLGDVDIVAADAWDWHFILLVNLFEIKYKDGSKTGDVVLADVLNKRVPNSYFKAAHLANLKRPPVYLEVPVVAHYPKDRLGEYCINIVGSIDKNTLTPIRKLFR